MIDIRIPFDLQKYASCSDGFKEYIQTAVKYSLQQHGISHREVVFRGGFGRKEDLERLIVTGSDYEDATIRLIHQGKEVRAAATFATSFERLGREPWARGLDPIYWAIKGHAFHKPRKVNGRKYNPVSVLAAFWTEKVEVRTCEVAAFKSINPSPDNIAALLYLDFCSKSRQIFNRLYRMASKKK
ncbi:hypothetical protein HY501_00155 [Candidatus Woesearchaeota archaeon]|nr:hypothetical protein [Candidatus Woesearchaeota archaeon]